MGVKPEKQLTNVWIYADYQGWIAPNLSWICLYHQLTQLSNQVVALLSFMLIMAPPSREI